jgi:CheY-like chemotaxis protein
MSLMEQQIGDSDYFKKADKMVKRIIDLVDNLKSITALRQQDYLTSKIIDIKASSQKTIQDSQRQRILIIDDEKELMDSLVDILRISGYECEGVSSGTEALERIGVMPYSIIISDIDMPEMAGTELFKKIKETGYQGSFIFMTGYEVDDDLGDVVKLADAFLSKPFQLTELKDIVDRILNSKEKNA